MTGLDLESFLQLLRADLGAWATLGLVVVVLGLLTWTSWGSRRALRKCLVLSIAAHVGIVLYSSSIPIVMTVLRNKPARADDASVRLQLAPTPGGTLASQDEVKGRDGRSAKAAALWDRAGDATGLGDPSAKAARPEEKGPLDEARPPTLGALPPESVVLEVNPPPPTAPANTAAAPIAELAATPSVAPGDPVDVARPSAPKPAEPAPAELIGGASRLRPDRGAATGPAEVARPSLPINNNLTAAPIPAIPGPLPTIATPGSAASPSAPPASIALGDPSDIAAPRITPRTVDSSPGGRDVVADPDARGRARREASSPGVSPLTLLNPTRPAPTPARPMVIPPTLTPAASAEAGTGSPAQPGSAGPLAPTSVAADIGGSNPAPATTRLPSTPAPRETLPDLDARRQSRPARETPLLALNDRRPGGRTVANLPGVGPAGAPGLPAIAGGTAGLTRLPTEVPAVYRSRLDPNRFARALRSGASRESEQAVERALDWLRRHQDADGRWDGGTAKYKDGTVAEGDDDYTAHCPAGDICFGECFYWEADSAITGLALLAYLGAGYTHLDGQYAETVGRGLGYLRSVQKPDGDLRGRSQAVGMYCHAMATLALCEAYALTGDPKLRAPVEKAVDFLVKCRAKDGLAWRYAPGAPVGDTSILGWVVMVLKSAQEVGIPIQPTTRQGILTWLSKVADGPSSGLGRYQPWEKVTPTMTAEAWVCRQFLGVGGPGASSTEAAQYLLQYGPNRGQFNLYYLYYGTLALYQHGGDAWTRWNAQVRDEILRRQRPSGHAAGSWDPDESQYGTHGGRIYCTALATLSLEVYYRYLRLYEAPSMPRAAEVPPATRSPR
jgi:hypothetical protein